MDRDITAIVEQQKRNIERRTMSVEDLCIALGIGKSKAYELMNIEDFPVIKNGRKYLIIKSKLDSWLEENVGLKF